MKEVRIRNWVILALAIGALCVADVACGAEAGGVRNPGPCRPCRQGVRAKPRTLDGARVDEAKAKAASEAAGKVERNGRAPEQRK